MRFLTPGTHVATITSFMKTTCKVRKAALFLFSVAVLLASGAAPVRGQSALDGFDPNANGPVYVVVVQPDGKILIGGGFTTLSPNGGVAVTRNRIARLNPDGTLDTAFNPNANFDVYAIALQADGKILAGGQFNNIGGQSRNRIARLDATTGLADSFDPNANNNVVSIAVQADGKILAAGAFNGANSIGGQSRNFIARLDATTGLADSFDPNANSGVDAIAVQADGKIIASGFFTNIGGATRNFIARLDSTTGLADSFDPNADDEVISIAVQADGRVLAGGSFTNIGGQPRNFIARLDPTNGSADSFDPNANAAVLSLAVQADGKILAGGFFANIGGQPRNFIARLDATTGLADSFNPNGNDLVFSIAVQADGKILAGGDFTTLAPNGGAAVTRNHITRLETDGRLDQTLDLGTLGGGGSVSATALQPNGKILIGGDFTSVLGVARNYIARLNTDGTLDTAFNPNANGFVDSLAVQADGKILAGGLFTNIGGQTRNFIARLDADTGMADSFNPNANSDVRTMALQADGKILAGGQFQSVGGQTRNFIARIDPTTGLADSFNPNADDIVYAIAVQADGKILAVGAFFGANSIGGQTRNFIARIDAATGLADSFDPKADEAVFAIAVQADGKILAGGFFTNIGGQPRNRIARLDATTGLADSFNPNADGDINSIAVQADGKILAGGGFNSIGGQTRDHFARLSNDTAALQSLAVTQSATTWTRGGSSPQFTRVTFESSTDNVTYTPLGSGTAAGGNWTLTGLGLPTRQNIYIRARGYYNSGGDNASESIAESVRNAFLTQPGTFGNISTRLRVETGDNVLIGGFIITGSQPKKVMVRAIGPSLPLADVLPNPTLELHDGMGTLITSNDNWMDAPNKQEIIDSALAPTNDLESAILLSLDPGLYTAIVRGVNDTTGIGLVEAYDLDLAADSILANISTRGLVQTGDNVMIGGIIILGVDPQEVLLRAIGPSLPLTGALADPTLELHDKDGVTIASNDDWRSDQEAEIIATTIPPTDDAESAILATLTPDAYTAIVRGKNDTTGIALVEAYQLDN
jgi:uncharacterized delta-60 repeat protein